MRSSAHDDHAWLHTFTRLAVRCRPCHEERSPPGHPPDRPRPAPSPGSFEADLSAPVLAAGNRLPNVRQISERVAMGRRSVARARHRLRRSARRAAARLHPAGRALRPGRRQHADGRRAGRGDRPVAVGDEPARRRARPAAARRAPPGTRGPPPADAPPDPARARRAARRRSGRADQFLSAVRPLPTAERAIVAMGVAALATHAISRRGRLIRTTPRVASGAHRRVVMDIGRINRSSRCASSTATRTARGASSSRAPTSRRGRPRSRNRTGPRARRSTSASVVRRGGRGRAPLDDPGDPRG